MAAAVAFVFFIVVDTPPHYGSCNGNGNGDDSDKGNGMMTVIAAVIAHRRLQLDQIVFNFLVLETTTSSSTTTTDQ